MISVFIRVILVSFGVELPAGVTTITFLSLSLWSASADAASRESNEGNNFWITFTSQAHQVSISNDEFLIQSEMATCRDV